MNWRGTGIAVFIFIAAGFAVWGLRQNRPKVNPPAEPKSMEKTTEIQITSTDFENNGIIPARFTCDGDPTSPKATAGQEDVSPPLKISGVPAEAKSLALIMHDPDAPRAGGWTHWVKWNISPMTMTITEGQEPEGTSGKGTGGESVYQGPCPPSGTHRYFFKIYALDIMLDLKTGATKGELEKAMASHIVGQGELVGLYARRS